MKHCPILVLFELYQNLIIYLISYLILSLYFLHFFTIRNVLHIHQITILRNSNYIRIRVMGFSGRFLSQQNTDSPESFLCASSLLWFPCQLQHGGVQGVRFPVLQQLTVYYYQP